MGTNKQGTEAGLDRVCFCPVVNKEITAGDCFDAALVYEETSPLSEMPKGMVFTDENQSTCIKCKYHPR